MGKYVENIVRFHHEKWNGSGYPLGLKGEEIPIEARIISILDTYDNLRQNKLYRKELTHIQALEIIKLEKNKSFDSNIVDFFLAKEKIIEEIYINTVEANDLSKEYYDIIKNKY